MQFAQLTWREVITFIGGAAAAWPLAARTQQTTGLRLIAFLHPYSENDPESYVFELE